MEKFLEFWSHYNAAIIETLVALILVSAIYLAYRSFFADREGEAHQDMMSGGGALSSAHLEKTLQKILDQQSSRTGSLAAGTDGELQAERIQELGFLKKALEEKEKQIVVLQAKAAQAEKAVQAGTGGPSAEQIAAAASAAAGLAEKQRTDYESKIKELEARLAEYEIISEDIADLSFFKEENARLTKELEAARSGAGPEGSVGGIETPLPAESLEANSLKAASLETASLETVPMPMEEPMAAAESTPAPAAAAESEITELFAEANSSLDDSLMAEFAKAVEEQKSGADAKPETTDEDENSKLIAEFENFNKKS